MKPDRKALVASIALCAATLAHAAEPDWLRPVEVIEAVPLLDDAGREGYGRFLQVTLRPRAFAIGLHGAWAWHAGENAAAEALRACQAEAQPCQLYAVDDEVVLAGYELGVPLRALGSRLVQGSPR